MTGKLRRTGHKKRKIFIPLAVLLTIFFVLAAGKTTVIEANDDSQRVFDYAGLLTEEETEELERQCLEAEERINTELYILTTEDTEGKTSTAYADDFGDEHAFGYEEPYGTYIILLIDMDNRNAWISISGMAIAHFTEARINSALDDIFLYLPDGNYYQSCVAFIDAALEYMNDAPINSPAETDPNRYPDTVYVYDNVHDNEGMLLDIVLIRLAISVVLGAVITALLAFRASTRMTADGRTYSRNGTCRINSHSDRYLRTTTTSHKIQTNSGGGGSSSGGGSHTSSGGHSHGGGGRSF